MAVDHNFIKKIGVSIFAIYVSLLLSILFGVNSIEDNSLLNNLFYYSLPIIMGLVIFPLCMVHFKVLSVDIKPNFAIGYIELGYLLIAAIVIILRLDTGLEYILSVFIIAFSEEFLFRHFLINDSNNKYILLISSLVFAFIVHINEPLFSNLLIRFPLGLVLGIVFRKKKNLIGCIVLHFIYNLMMS